MLVFQHSLHIMHMAHMHCLCVHVSFSLSIPAVLCLSFFYLVSLFFSITFSFPFSLPPLPSHTRQRSRQRHLHAAVLRGVRCVDAQNLVGGVRVAIGRFSRRFPKRTIRACARTGMGVFFYFFLFSILNLIHFLLLFIPK